MTLDADTPRTATTDLAMVRRYPAIHRGLRRHPLCVLPTPVAPLERLAAARGLGPLWVKRDDLTCGLYGGNKPRKLEWLLGAAQARGRRVVMTFGGIGTHHGLATAICAHDAGLRTVLVLMPQPVTPAVRHSLLLHHAFGCEMHLAESVGGIVVTATRRLLQGARRGEPPAIIPTGGTSALGAVGYVNAACELADQVRAGLLPEPAAIFVAVGSGGTLAGLQLGLRLAGLRSTVVGVLVTDILPPSPRRLASLARGALRRLRRVAPSMPDVHLGADEIVIERGFLGAGYGAVSDDGLAAQRLLADSEGLAVETTYTAKTVAAMLALAERPPYRGQPLLFWNTYSSVDPAASLSRLPDWHELPPAFHRFFM